ALRIEDAREAELQQRLSEVAATAIDLSCSLPLRAWLFKLTPTHHVLVLVLHHIAADGWSMKPLARDLTRAYAARCRGEAAALPDLPAQYADYALWQRRTLGSVA